jgi:RimJ/RimL family protein N-acetyltransferase
MPDRRLDLVTLTPGDFPEVAEVYQNSRHFLVELSGEKQEDLGVEMVKREAVEAHAHGAIFAGIRLKENRQLTGVVTYQPGGYRDQPSQAWIALLMIAEKFQSRGYGAEAYRLVEEAILSNPEVHTIKLGVLPNNPRGLEFWQRMGYRDTGVLRQNETGQKIIIMEKLRTPSGG